MRHAVPLLPGLLLGLFLGLLLPGPGRAVPAGTAVPDAAPGASKQLSALDVTPPAGWQTEPAGDLPRNCRRYGRTDGQFRLTVCPAAAPDSRRLPDGWRRMDQAQVHSSAQALVLLAPGRHGTEAALFTLTADSALGTLRRQEAAPMLAALAGRFAIPEALLAAPAAPSRYLGSFSPEGRTKAEELGCTAYFRTVTVGDRREKLLVTILPRSEAWLDAASLHAVMATLWGDLFREGQHWKADADHHLALAADGRALCLLICVSGSPPGAAAGMRQAMRDLSPFVW